MRILPLILATTLAAASVHAQTRTSLSLCPKTTVAAGDKWRTVRSATGTLCIVKDTAAVAPPPVTPTPVPPAGPSVEPTGMAKLAENPMDSVRASGWYFAQDYTNGAVVVKDTAAPRSASSVVQQNYTPSLVPGSSPASIGMSISPKKTIYAVIWMKVSSNYLGHASTANKVIHFYTASRSGTQGGENIAVFNLFGAGSGALTPGFILQNIAAPYQGGTATLLFPNVGSCTTVRGRWHRYEMMLTSNMPGVADGRAELWMDGTKCVDNAGITFAPSGTDSRWNAVNWSPTYGGAGGTITSSFYTQVDHLYVSGK